MTTKKNAPELPERVFFKLYTQQDTARFAKRISSMTLVVLIGVFTSELARATLAFCLLTNASFRWFFVVTAHLHLTKKTLALHFLFQRAECLINIVITNYNFNQTNIPPFRSLKMMPQNQGRATNLAFFLAAVKAFNALTMLDFHH